jgi:hypothetical protein
MRLIRRPAVICLCIVMAVTGFARGAEESTTTEVSTTSEAVPGATDSALSLVSRVPFKFSISVDAGYDTNVNNANSSSDGSGYGLVRADLSYDGGTQRTHFTLTIGADLTYYFQGAADPNPETNTRVHFTLRHSVDSRLSLLATLDAEYRAEPDFSQDVGPNRRSGYFFTTNDFFSATYAWTSLISTVTSENFRWVKYDNSTVGAFEDRIENTIGQQLKFNLSGRTALVGEYRFELIDYDRFPHDSTSQYILGGIDHSFSERASMSLRGGATLRSYSQNGTDQTEPYFSGSFLYAIGRRSSLNWNVSYSLESPDSPLIASTKAFRTGLQFTYGLTARITTSLAAYYVHQQNESFDFPGVGSFSTTEDSYDVSLNVGYSINRHWGVHVGLQTSGNAMDIANSDYTRERYSAGVNYSF